MLIMQVVMCNVKCLLKERGLTGNGSDCLILCCSIVENGENLFLKKKKKIVFNYGEDII